MTSKPRVLLYDARGLGCIILWPTGIEYSNQTGGYACLHPTAEGFYVPLFNELFDQEALLRRHFEGPKWRGFCDRGIDEETALEVERILDAALPTRELGLTVDRERLADSHEAWIHVNVPAQRDRGGGALLPACPRPGAS